MGSFNNIKSSSSQEETIMQNLRRQLEAKNSKIKNLKQQNRILIKQFMPNNRLTKQYTLDTLMHMNYQMFTCLLCQNFFDELAHLPIMTCKNQHTICESCIKINQILNSKKCISCPQPFKNYGKNRSILHLITNKQDLLNWVKERDAGIQQEVKQVQMEAQLSNKTQIHLCRYKDYATMFEMNGDSLLKLSNQASWHTIRSTQSLSDSSKSQVSFKIINSAHNSLIVGITSQIQQFQKGFIPSSSIAFHLNNGHIYQQASPNQFKWKTGGAPVIKNTNSTISMTVDPQQKIVKWKVQNKSYGQCKIPNKFLTQKLYVFIAIYHKGDMIVFNK